MKVLYAFANSYMDLPVFAAASKLVWLAGANRVNQAALAKQPMAAVGA